MKLTYARAALTCITLSALLVLAFILTGCYTPAEFRAQQELEAQSKGLICDASLSRYQIVEHVQVGSSSEAAKHCDGPAIGRKTIGCYRLLAGDDLSPKAHIWYTAGDSITRCHEITHAVCGLFHDAYNKFDKKKLRDCAEKLILPQSIEP